MKLITKIAAAALMAVSLLASADDAPRHEAVLDTGKGGLHIVVSVPNFAQGPYDFAKNPGPKNNKFDSGAYSEVMYNAPVSDSAVVVYQVNALSRFVNRKDADPVTPEALAKGLLKDSGFTMDRAVKIDSPQVGIEGASVVTYKVSGFGVFNGKEDRFAKDAMIVTAVALPGQNQGYAISARLTEKDIAKFDADQAKYDKGATRAHNDLYKNSIVKKN
ncbi:hypothetical protein [Dechloromonas sp. HYN0024]|uniref:hypothetical protein n=1 Tax=Dechloromonas sp. HYN0024 TaxID=2231055 RepID=UPI0013C2C31C|nr:hypothetical protein [Dechloromonas sp. HYN0024]